MGGRSCRCDSDSSASHADGGTANRPLGPDGGEGPPDTGGRQGRDAVRRAVRPGQRALPGALRRDHGPGGAGRLRAAGHRRARSVSGHRRRPAGTTAGRTARAGRGPASPGARGATKGAASASPPAPPRMTTRTAAAAARGTTTAGAARPATTSGSPVATAASGRRRRRRGSASPFGAAPPPPRDAGARVLHASAGCLASAPSSPSADRGEGRPLHPWPFPPAACPPILATRLLATRRSAAPRSSPSPPNGLL